MRGYHARYCCLVVAILCLGAGPAQEESVRVALGGDVIFGRWQQEQWVPVEEGPEHRDLRRRLAGADLAMINLETAICEEEQARRWASVFRDQPNRFTASAEELQWLVQAGIDMAVIANNHALDCGPKSIVWTEEALAERGIGAAGGWHPGDGRLGRVVELEVNGAPVVVVAATAHPPASVNRAEAGPVTLWQAYRGAPELVEGIQNLRRDQPRALIVVSLHWGVEFQAAPLSWQRQLAHDLVDGGADLIFGHGPHTVQPTEFYAEAAIVYSAGNLRFEMRESLAGKPQVTELEFVRSGKGERRWRVRNSEPREP